MAANPFEPQYEYGPDGLPIKKLPSNAPEMTPQERVIPSLGNPVPAQPVGLASPALAVSTQPPKTLESLGPSVPTFTNSSVPGFATARGGYVGARTDAEAARSLQDRALQSQAADFNIQQMNRGAEALRDLRATKLGISSDTLAAMEGRGGTWASEGPMTVVGKEGVNFGDEASRQSQIDGLLSRAASQTGFGGSKRAASMTAAAQAMMAPQMARDEQQAGLMGKQMDLQSDRAKSLADLYSRQSITPYQQQSLNLQQQQLDSTQGLKRQETVTKGLDNIQANLYGSQEYKNYVTTQPMLQTVKDLAGQDTPTAGTALATAVAKSRDPSTGVLSGEVKAIMEGSGNLPQRALGWINSNILGGNPFTPGVRQDMVNATASQVNNYRDQAMAKVDSLIPELKQRGIALDTVLNENDLKNYQEWKAKQSGQSTQQTPQYRWTENGLVPY